MEVTFGSDQQPVAPAPASAAPTTAPAAPETQTPAPSPAAVAARPGGGAVGKQTEFLLGDILPDLTEIIFPRLNIVQNIGQLQESFDNGAIVLNQQHVLFLPPIINTQTGNVERKASPPVIITAIGFRPTRYAEKTVGGAKGMIVNTEEQVRANGGTLDYAEWNLKKDSGMKRFEPLADALVVIEKPDAFPLEAGAFDYGVDGKHLALALWAMKGSAYTEAAKRVFFTNRRIGMLRQGGYPSWSFAFTTREKTYETGNKAWVPVLVANKRQTEPFFEFVRQVLNAPQTPAE